MNKKRVRQDSYALKNIKHKSWIQQMFKHTNITQLYETLEADNSYYIVIKLCIGGDLLDRTGTKTN